MLRHIAIYRLTNNPTKFDLGEEIRIEFPWELGVLPLQPEMGFENPEDTKRPIVYTYDHSILLKMKVEKENIIDSDNGSGPRESNRRILYQSESSGEDRILEVPSDGPIRLVPRISTEGNRVT